MYDKKLAGEILQQIHYAIKVILKRFDAMLFLAVIVSVLFTTCVFCGGNTWVKKIAPLPEMLGHWEGYGHEIVAWCKVDSPWQALMLDIRESERTQATSRKSGNVVKYRHNDTEDESCPI